MIIVGASLAGAKAAEGARSEGWTRPIRLVGAEPYLPYERPPLSKGVLTGGKAPSTAAVHDGDFYVTNKIDVLLGVAATRIDLADRRIELHGGRDLHFAKLILATGSSPRRLTGEGAELPEVFYLRTLDDCLALRDRLIPGTRVAVIGASWIGTEVAACARQRGCEVAVIDPLSTPLERVLGPDVGRFFAELHRGHGVELHLGAQVDAIEGSDHVSGVRLSAGTVIPADVVVVGIGVTPNIDVARDCGLAVDHGVLVDASLATSHPDVYAAGDIAEATNPAFGGGRVRVEHWANALNQGLMAGSNAAGATGQFERIPYFYSDQYDMGMEYSGWPTAWDSVAFRGNPDDGAFVAFYLRDGRVIGGANVNVWDVNEHVQRLIRAGTAVDPERLTDLDVSPEAWTSPNEGPQE